MEATDTTKMAKKSQVCSCDVCSLVGQWRVWPHIFWKKYLKKLLIFKSFSTFVAIFLGGGLLHYKNKLGKVLRPLVKMSVIVRSFTKYMELCHHATALHYDALHCMKFPIRDNFWLFHILLPV